jgi:hypothetical protein
MWCETVRKWENASSIATGYSEPARWRGLSPAADQRLFTAHCSHLLRLSFRGCQLLTTKVYDRIQKCTYQVTFGVR